jgi:hypothetical protein
VRLKKFEEVVADLLPLVTPEFVRIPILPPGSSASTNDWPFDQLPPLARVKGAGSGQLSCGKRAERKEGQLRSLVQCLMAMIPPKHQMKIIDFAGGSGHLAIPLAILLPQCQIVVVDVKMASLRLVHEKARNLQETDNSLSVSRDDKLTYPKGEDVTKHEQIKRQCAGIPNLYTYHGSIESFQEPFDIGVSLHACGEASDLVLRACGRARANFCVAPCCVGKLNRQRFNPYIYHATAGNEPTVLYPQSSKFGFVSENDWNALAKAADYSDWDEMRSARNAARRTAKALLETDRLLFMRETYGYNVALTRMDPWECSPKNDILLGWMDESTSPFHSCEIIADSESNNDIELTFKHLLSSTYSDENQDSVDWTWEEERDTRRTLEEFQQSSERKLIFPTGMGARRRKLVHYLAEQMGFTHWCLGDTRTTRTVAVAKKKMS